MKAASWRSRPLASAEGGQDPVDAAVRAAAALHKTDTDLPKVTKFVPFDPDHQDVGSSRDRS